MTGGHGNPRRRAAELGVQGRSRPERRGGRRALARVFGVAVLAYLAVLAGAGLDLGASAARGPDRTLASELVVDGGRLAESPTHEGRPPRNTKRRPPREPPDVTVHVARSEEDVESLRSAWTALQDPHLTSDIDFFLTVVRHAPGVVRPHVVLIERSGRPLALVAARVEDAFLPARLGYGVGFSPRLRMLTVAYGGFLGVGAPDSAVVLEKLRESLAGEQLDLVRLRMLELGSSMHAAASAQPAGLRRRRFAGESLHWRCAIPDSFEQFLASRSKERRRHVRRYQRRLEEAHPGEVEVRLFSSGLELDRLFEDSGRVHRTTYQHALGVGFSDDELSRRLAELTMDRGWFRGAVLYIRGEPAAFWHGNEYRGTFATTATGFDPAFAEDRPGTFLLMKLIESLCADPAVHTLDFGFGDAEYKRHFGDTSVLEEDIVVFEPGLRPVAVNVAQNALLGTAALGRGLLSRSGHLRAARSAWRRRLSRSRGI